MIFYCKPYCKVQNSMDKKNQNQQNQFGGAAAYGGYQDSISKPAFITQDKNKEKEVFLNGEVNTLTRKQNTGQVKKTNLCLKGLMVEHSLGREAVKNYYNMVQK